MLEQARGFAPIGIGMLEFWNIDLRLVGPTARILIRDGTLKLFFYLSY